MEALVCRDAFLPADDATALKLADLMRGLEPEVVITHWHGSWHKDHRAAAELTQTALFFAALPTLARSAPAHRVPLLVRRELGGRCRLLARPPGRRLDGFDAWSEAVEAYELARGLSSFPYVDYYTALYRLRGCLRGTQHAQAFAAASNSWNAGIGLFAPSAAGSGKDRP